ncbi:MAG: creatininase family protein [Gemmatimonadota bacterium]
MRTLRFSFALFLLAPVVVQLPAQTGRAVLLENLTWQEAERALTRTTVVVIPLGAGAKEHGPHLKLSNDLLIAEYLKRRVLDGADVVMAPMVTYNYYPAFVLYPGSTSLTIETARDMIVQIVRSLASFGPRKFYVLNTGVSTLGPLRQARAILAVDTIDMQFTNLGVVLADVEKQVSKQEGGTHADEIETSMMLYMAPATVDMKKAVRDYRPSKGRLVRDSTMPGTYSPTGIWGDPTLATREKGALVTEALVAGILKDIQRLRSTP